MSKTTLKDVFKDFFGDPPMYRGYPVDLSVFDKEIMGYVVEKPKIPIDKFMFDIRPHSSTTDDD